MAADVDLRTGQQPADVGSSYAMFITNEATPKTILLPIVGTVALTDAESQETWPDAYKETYPLRGTKEGTVTLTVAASDATARNWANDQSALDDTQSKGQLWINLNGEDGVAGTKQWVIIPQAKIYYSASVATPGVTTDYVFGIGSLSGSAPTVFPTTGEGWPYTVAGITGVAAGSRVVYGETVIT